MSVHTPLSGRDHSLWANPHTNITCTRNINTENCPHQRRKKRTLPLHVKGKRFQRAWKNSWNCFDCSSRRHIYPLQMPTTGKNALWKHREQILLHHGLTVQKCMVRSHLNYQEKDPSQQSAKCRQWMLLPIFVTRENSAFSWAARNMVILRWVNIF